MLKIIALGLFLGSVVAKVLFNSFIFWRSIQIKTLIWDPRNTNYAPRIFQCWLLPLITFDHLSVCCTVMMCTHAYTLCSWLVSIAVALLFTLSYIRILSNLLCMIWHFFWISTLDWQTTDFEPDPTLDEYHLWIWPRLVPDRVSCLSVVRLLLILNQLHILFLLALHGWPSFLVPWHKYLNWLAGGKPRTKQLKL